MEEFEIEIGKKTEPFTVTIYGPPKSGKTFLAANAPNPLFLDAEQGTGKISTARVNIADGFALFRAMGWAAKQNYDTIIVDSLTAIEKMLTEKVCQENGWKNIDAPGFGKGKVVLRAEWMRFIKGMFYLKSQGKNVILIAHSRVKAFADPMSESYDRYEPDIDKEAITLVTSSVDGILFLRPRTMVRQTEDEKRQRATGTGRELHTQESPAFVAGNRFSLKPVYLDPGLDVWQDILKGCKE